MKLRVKSRYSSSLGSYQAGDVVDVDDAIAALIQRDSPGSFEPAGPPPSNPEPKNISPADVERNPTVSDQVVPDRRYKSGYKRKT